MNPSYIGNTTNYLVPAAGQTHAVAFNQIFSATPQVFDWRQFAIDNFPFQPQGAFIDNTAGVGPLIVNIQPLNFNVVVPAGVGSQVQFPAPNGQTISVTGDGQAVIVFVDFPVLPNAGLIDIGNTVKIIIDSVTPGVTVPVQPTQSAAGGLPYLVEFSPANLVPEYVTLSGAALTANVAPPANSNLRKLLLSVTENASLAAAGYELVTVTLNGVQIFRENINMPAVAGSGQLKGWTRNITFENAAFNVGAAGLLVVTIGTALATGILDLNAYFD